ncbi:Tetratricopeptide repeat-containing protein [Rubritalea squalenifaciens DSM 18772]|uniref:Tetratricopeptide repeat-containing protein n=1 Tax=Rubritalea squalenifaciens DSM 18772 TaxID=1123071 RepID=A0A1M6E388_9BACT|nr:von Willebrand factor type A domain-containing protein [Rubritalea squalenifaciens]SHI79849.1 Tetratricopeptide repeat-containing protein [Rubritalea squalenifaciens DSM 18772]
MSDDKIEAWNDPEVEARIIAMVMGEASDFEQAELQRLMQEDPALQRFHDEMLALHENIALASAPDQDDEWKLPPKRRSELLEHFGTKSEDETVALPTPLPLTSPYKTFKHQWRSATGIAACLVITVVIVAVMNPNQEIYRQVALASKEAPEIMSFSAGSDADMSQEKPEVANQVERKPSAPSSSMAEVIASQTKSPIIVPAPQMETNQPSIDFGDGDDFGGGWGNADGQLAKNEASHFARIAKEDAFSDEVRVEYGANYDYGISNESSKADLAKKKSTTAQEDPTARFSYRSGSSQMAKGSVGKTSAGVTVNDVRGGLKYDLAADITRSNAEDTADSQVILGNLIQREVAVRASRTNEADAAFLAGRKAYAEKDYETAIAEYRKAEAMLPAGPVAEQRRKAFQDHLHDGNIALSQQYRRTGRYQEARQLLQQVLEKDPSHSDAKQQLTYLESPIQTSPVLTYEHAKQVDEVRKGLYQAEGLTNLGRFDEAEEKYKEVLRSDRYNQAARRGLEKIAKLNSDYYRAAYDHTRSEMLRQVDQAWEIDVPPTLLYPTEYEPPELPNDTAQKSESYENLLANWMSEEQSVNNNDLTHLLPSLESDKTPDSESSTKKLEEKKQAPPLNEEIPAAEQPESTFSLNVSDVSFKLAQAAMLERNTWPAAESVRIEEFVNAFDYADPTPSMQEKVSCAIEQSVHPFRQQRNLMRISMSTAAQGRNQPLDLTILLDNSGSMDREDREAAVLKAMEVLGKQLGPNDRITLMSFALDTRLLADRITGDKAAGLVELVSRIPSEGGTNLEKAVKAAHKHALSSRRENSSSRVIILTDGAANLGNADPEKLTTMIEKMREHGIAFDACGIGTEGLDDGILEALTRKGDGRYYLINRAEDADAGFARQVAGALRPAAQNVKVQVIFNPDRVSKYRLLGFEKHRLKTEDFRNDKVDAAEMAAEESGSALYQFEPNPEGQGDIGEVFVRFRDMESGQMVERSWTIPYQKDATHLNEAKPSMQLAATAGLLADKLHGTDSGTTDFNQYNKVLGSLRAQFPSDQRVQQLIQMCEKTK